MPNSAQPHQPKPATPELAQRRSLRAAVRQILQRHNQDSALATERTGSEIRLLDVYMIRVRESTS